MQEKKTKETMLFTDKKLTVWTALTASMRCRASEIFSTICMPVTQARRYELFSVRRESVENA